MARGRFWVLFCAALAAAAAGEAAGDELLAGDAAAWGEDDACPAGVSAEECSLSLRQLRVRGVTTPPVAPPETAAEAAEPPQHTGVAALPSDEAILPDEEFVNDTSDGVPGGWGEAAEYADYITPDEAGIQPEGRWGSCRIYGCHGHYHRHFACQCNPGCQRHGSCCSDYQSKCRRHHHGRRRSPPPSHGGGGGGSHGNRVLTLFHQTSQDACKAILRSNFRPGSRGWCGGGIYFATSPDATETKAIGPDSHKGCILQARVNVGRVWHLSKHCNRGLHGSEVWKKGYDSVSFDPGDGTEYVVYKSSQVVSIKRHR